MKVPGASVLLACCLAAGAFSASFAATDPLGNANRLPPSLEQKVEQFGADLRAQGYEVARGYWTLWSTEDCRYPIRTVGSCYGNNPTAPYALAVVPRWPEEFVDQSMHHALNEARRNMSASYRLGEREALVVLAELPPPGRYFGIQSNVFTREDTINPDDPIYQRLTVNDPSLLQLLFSTSPNPARVMMVASIGDSINNVVIDRRTGENWQAGQQRFFVITPDADMARAMTEALLRAGVPTADHIFREAVSPELVHLGYAASADDLITYVRYALPDDPALGQQWRAKLPLTILRVRDTSRTDAVEPLPVPAYETRSWNFNETDPAQGLASDLAALALAVQARWQQAVTPRSFISAYKAADLVGQHCLGRAPNPERGPMNCLGDTQDADYQISTSLQLDGNEVVALVGTLATETGNATYVSLAVNRFPQLVGVANIDDQQLTGSAARFQSALQHDARLFYVQYVARDCTGLGQWCIEIPRRLVPAGATIKMLQRNYVSPGSNRGPDPARVLNPLAIVFDGTHRPVQP